MGITLTDTEELKKKLLDEEYYDVRKIYTEREIIDWWTYAYYSSFDITFGDKEVARVLAENDWGGVCKATGQRAICVGETLFLRRKQYILLTNDSREVVDLRIWAEIENNNKRF
ncbi:hypothetical protein VNN28_10005 (plasmid) [Lactococcus formosensis]|uniref:hypothetical protein n=1 Tax=Lactococcus formosensis TaxID=1281486 RepID=UPI0030D48185